MDFFIRKASDYDWYDLKYFDTIQELMEFYEACDNQIIIGTNIWTDAHYIRESGPKGWKNDAEDIAHCQYELLIYDDYIE